MIDLPEVLARIKGMTFIFLHNHAGTMAHCSHDGAVYRLYAPGQVTQWAFPDGTRICDTASLKLLDEAFLAWRSSENQLSEDHHHTLRLAIQAKKNWDHGKP